MSNIEKGRITIRMSKERLPKVTPLTVLLVMIAVCSALTSGGAYQNQTLHSKDYRCPSECECYRNVLPNRPHVYVLHCLFDSIGPTDNFTLLQDVPTLLFVKCTDSIAQSHIVDYMFKGLHSIIGISLVNCKFSSVPQFAFSGLWSLEELKIEGARHLHFHKNAFAEMPSLTSLSIIGSASERIPNVCGLSELWAVNLTDNYIRNFESAGLLCVNGSVLSRLEIIDLTRNKIVSLSSTMGLSYPYLRRLSLAENKISYLDENALINLQQLVWLDLNNNSITRLPATLFSRCRDLQILGIAVNSVKEIPFNMISALRHLWLLELHHTQVNDSLWRELYLLREMRVLRLGHNRLATIDAPVLANFPGLEEIDLSGNRLNTVPPYAFKKQANLQILDLSQNQITLLHEHALFGMENLTTLYLFDNYINTLHKDTFKTLSKLQTLDMRRNRLQYVHTESLIPLQSVKSVNLSYNSIENLPSLTGLFSLNLLDVRMNRIRNISSDVFHGLDSLIGVNMMNNQIQEIPRLNFSGKASLQLLHLAFNDIEKIADNAFDKVSTALLVLLLNNNNIADISHKFHNLPTLQKLDLSHNRISGTIYGELFPASLEQISLSYNFITGLRSFTFSHITRLFNVDLRFNLLQNLISWNIEVSSQTPVTPVFSISGNKFVCDCHLEWLKPLLSRTRPIPYQPIIRDLDVVWCQTAYNYNYTLLYKVPKENFLCNYTEACISTSCPCCDFHHCDCKFICPDQCSCFRSNDWSGRHYVDCEKRGLRNVPLHIPKLATDVILSGNNISTIATHAFLGMSNVNNLFLNNCRMEILQDGAFVGLTKITRIYLQDNRLSALNQGVFKGLANLTVLNLQRNRIHLITDDTFDKMTNLQSLNLQDNNLDALSANVLSSLSSLKEIKLSGNMWICQCEFMALFLNWTHRNAAKMNDINGMQCLLDIHSAQYSRNKMVKILDFEMETFCPNETVIYNVSYLHVTSDVLDEHYIVALSVSLVLVILGFALVVLVYWNRHLVKVWLYSRYSIRWCRSPAPDDENRIYDAFVSYCSRSAEDEYFIIHELVPRLERGNPKFKLCLHFRDFPVGACIADSIIESIAASKRTIMVLSNSFLESEWCQFEFQTAHHHVLKDRNNRLILIILGELDERKLDPDLKLYLKTRTYVKYGDPWFWEKIYYALPDKKPDEEPQPYEKMPQFHVHQNGLCFVLPTVMNGTFDPVVYEEPVPRAQHVGHCPLADYQYNSESLSGDSTNIYEEIHPV